MKPSDSWMTKQQSWEKIYENFNLPLVLLFEQRNYGRRLRPDIEGKQKKVPRLEPLETLHLEVLLQLLTRILQLRNKPHQKSQRYSILIPTSHMPLGIMLQPYDGTEQLIPTRLNQFVSSFLLDNLLLTSYYHRESLNTEHQRADISELQKRATNNNLPRSSAGNLAYDKFGLDLWPKVRMET